MRPFAILRIESSARPGSTSVSRRVTGRLLARLRADHPGAKVTLRDLAADPLPHVDARFVDATFTPEAERSAAQQAALAQSERLIEELEGADAVVIGVPMYNYGVPSALKAWLDHVVRARRTFRHASEGPVGLLRDRPVHLVVSAGGIYGQGPGVAMDFVVPYLRAVLGKIGLRDLRVHRVEGLALGPEVAEAALRGAEAAVAQPEGVAA